VLDGNFDTQLKDDEAAQHIYGINLCTDVADSLQVPKSRLSVCATSRQHPGGYSCD
jgi:hypothetical protein